MWYFGTTKCGLPMITEAYNTKLLICRNTCYVICASHLLFKGRSHHKNSPNSSLCIPDGFQPFALNLFKYPDPVHMYSLCVPSRNVHMPGTWYIGVNQARRFFCLYWIIQLFIYQIMDKNVLTLMIGLKMWGSIFTYTFIFPSEHDRLAFFPSLTPMYWSIGTQRSFHNRFA